MTTEPVMEKRYDRAHGITVDELVDWCIHHGLEPGQVTVFADLKYETPETDEEIAARVAWQARADARHEAWECETWERLRVKYGA